MRCTYPASTRAHHIGSHSAAMVAGIFTTFAVSRALDLSHLTRVPFDDYVGTFHRFHLTSPQEW